MFCEEAPETVSSAIFHLESLSYVNALISLPFPCSYDIDKLAHSSFKYKLSVYDCGGLSAEEVLISAGLQGPSLLTTYKSHREPLIRVKRDTIREYAAPAWNHSLLIENIEDPEFSHQWHLVGLCLLFRQVLELLMFSIVFRRTLFVRVATLR